MTWRPLGLSFLDAREAPRPREPGLSSLVHRGQELQEGGALHTGKPVLLIEVGQGGAAEAAEVRGAPVHGPPVLGVVRAT